MKPATTKFRRILRNATLGLGLAAVVGGVSMAPALADDYWHHDRRDVREHAWHHRSERWEHPREERYAYAAPRYDDRYAPAPAYVAPPSFNLVVPFSVR